jgi:hypothetical protein
VHHREDADGDAEQQPGTDAPQRRRWVHHFRRRKRERLQRREQFSQFQCRQPGGSAALRVGSFVR